MLYAAALTFILIHAIRSVDLTQRYRKSQFAALAVSALLIAHMFLVFITSGALAEEELPNEVRYRTYMRSAEHYTGQEFMVQLKVRRFVRDEDDNVTVYAYSDDNTANVFCLTVPAFDEYLWYDIGIGEVGITINQYSIIAANDEYRTALVPIPKVEKLLKGDKIIASVIGQGLTEDEEPLCEVQWMAIDD